MLAQSINHFLVVGVYLINLGFSLLQLQSLHSNKALDQALVFLYSRLGLVLLILGAAQFFNLFVISRFKTAQLSRMELCQRVESHGAMQIETYA